MIKKSTFFPYMQDRNYIISFWRKNNSQQLSVIGVIFEGSQKDGDIELDMTYVLVG